MPCLKGRGCDRGERNDRKKGKKKPRNQAVSKVTGERFRNLFYSSASSISWNFFVFWGAKVRAAAQTMPTRPVKNIPPIRLNFSTARGCSNRLFATVTKQQKLVAANVIEIFFAIVLYYWLINFEIKSSPQIRITTV